MPNQPVIDIKALEKAHLSEEDKGKARAVIDFVQLLMNDHNFDAILSQYQGRPYKQHNRTMTNDIEGVIKALTQLVKTAPEFSYDVKNIFVDGDHVILHSHATLKAKHLGDDTQGLNIMDTWRVVDGQLVEHWDAVQGLDISMRMYGLFTGGKIRNDNGVF